MLTDLLIHSFVKDSQSVEKPNVRLAYGTLAGYVGISVNVLLAVIKFITGFLAGSVAMAADAVNNLSDAGSSVVTVFGFKLSAKPADSEHPFGHGRLEYVAALIVSVIIISVGADFLKESIMRIFSPLEVHADNVILGLFTATLLFKIWLFFFYRSIGKKIDSNVLRAMAFDSLSDLVGTSVVIGSAFLGRFTSFPVDGCAGTLVATLVLIGGIGVLKNAVNPLLGELPDPELVKKLRTCLLQCPGICGVHDIILHNYGPNQYFATAHAEVAREGDLLSVHDTLEAAEVEVARHLPIRLILHCDPYNTEEPKVKNWRARTENEVSAFDSNFKLYDFRLEEDGTKIKLHFHLLMPRNYLLSYDQITETLTNAMRKYHSDIELKIEFINAYV